LEYMTIHIGSVDDLVKGATNGIKEVFLDVEPIAADGPGFGLMFIELKFPGDGVDVGHGVAGVLDVHGGDGKNQCRANPRDGFSGKAGNVHGRVPHLAPGDALADGLDPPGSMAGFRLEGLLLGPHG
jgi:hypothetical protein